MARELKLLLEGCGQHVPQELEELAVRDSRLLDECRAAITRMHGGSWPWPQIASSNPWDDVQRYPPQSKIPIVQ
jgi:hypothetical protein